MTWEQAQAELVSTLAAICAQRLEREAVQPLREGWTIIREWFAVYLQELAEAIRNVFATLFAACGHGGDEVNDGTRV